MEGAFLESKEGQKRVDVGGWKAVQELKDARLKGLCNFIPSVLLSAHAEATNKMYSCHFSRWKKWALAFDEVCALPAKPLHVACFLLDLGNKTGSASSIKQVLPAIV